jgi:hypothetical protein
MLPLDTTTNSIAVVRFAGHVVRVVSVSNKVCVCVCVCVCDRLDVDWSARKQHWRHALQLSGLLALDIRGR